MYIRWKRRRKKVDYWWTDQRETDVLYLSVCKSERINGKPRQKFLGHLGHIEECSLNHKPVLYDFWSSIEYRLSSLDEQTRNKLIEQIAKKVPQISEDEKKEIEQEQAISYAKAMAMLRCSG